MLSRDECVFVVFTENRSSVYAYVKEWLRSRQTI